MKAIADVRCLEELLASLVRYRPHARATQQSILSSRDIDALIAGYNCWLAASWDSPEMKRARERLKQDESLLFRGHCGHLSQTHREEHVSSWLAWILDAPMLDTALRAQMHSALFTDLIKCETYEKYVAVSPTFHPLSETAEIVTEEPIIYKSKDGEVDGGLDLVLNDPASKQKIVLEMKIGDLHLEKNCRYLDALRSSNPDWALLPMLIIPGADLDRLVGEDESDGASGDPDDGDEAGGHNGARFQSHVLEAFPPVTWEYLLLALRRLLERAEFQIISPRVAHWRTLVLTFISAMESLVLGFDVHEICEALEERGRLSASSLQQFREYIAYRWENRNEA